MVDPKKAYKYFKNNFVLTKPSPKQWYGFNCTVCDGGRHKLKMAVHFGRFHVKCWECGYAAALVEFVGEYEGISAYEARIMLYAYDEAEEAPEMFASLRQRDPVGKVTLPLGFNLLLDGTGMLGERARDYLEGRDFDLDLLDSMGFGYCNKKHKEKDQNFFGYIIVPFKRRGVLRYFIGRDYTGNYLRYKNPDSDELGVGKTDYFFNEDALDLYKEVDVMEGWTDAVTLGKKAMSTQGPGMSYKQKSKLLLSRVEVVTLIPDLGEDGQGRSFYRLALKEAGALMDAGKKVRVLNLVPFTDLGKDVNEIGKVNVEEIKKSAEVLTNKTLMEGLYE